MALWLFPTIKAYIPFKPIRKDNPRFMKDAPLHSFSTLYICFTKMIS